MQKPNSRGISLDKQDVSQKTVKYQTTLNDSCDSSCENSQYCWTLGSDV